MKRLGISISRVRLAAFAWEGGTLRNRALAAFSVPCTEPYGTPDDIRALAEGLRSALRESSLPQAVLSLPPGECHVRSLLLPVSGMKEARVIHRDEIEGTLPFDGEPFVSDILPAGGSEPPAGRYIAFAARRSVVEALVERFASASISIDRVVTDPVSLLCASAALGEERDRLSILSFETDAVFLALEGGRISRIRQFPAGYLEHADPTETGRIVPESDADELRIAGHAPARLSERLSGPIAHLDPPGGFPGASVVAFGAAVLPFSATDARGFTLFSPGGSVDDPARARLRRRTLAVAACVAALASLAAFETARWASSRQVASARRQLRTEFQTAVPGAKTVVRESTQIREKIASLRKQRTELGLDLPRITPLLAVISSSMPADRSLSVREISVEGSRIRIAGDSAGGRAVESYRTALSAGLGGGYSVTVQESRGCGRGDNVAFSILVEKGANDRAS